MKILFLIFHGLSGFSGISKKIINQMAGLKANGHEVTLCHYEVKPDGHRVRMIDDTVLQDYGNNKLAPIRKRISYSAIYRYACRHHIQMVYVRSFHNANPFTIHFFHKLHKAGIRIDMEIPTYPYDQEYSLLPFQWKAELFVDKCFRRLLAAKCDNIVTFSPFKTIFGQKTIQISNGINFEELPLRFPHPKIADEIHLLAVAEIHYWHGYDRIIEGLGLYYRHQYTCKVFLHLVGGIGHTEEELFRQLIDTYQLSSYIHFYGQKQDEELNTLFDKCDFAIGSLGRHRSGIDKIKTLKNREYAARGIAFIYSETDEDFDHMPYILKAPANDSPISIPEILNFYRTVTAVPQEIRNSVRHLSWNRQMQIVVQQTFTK